MLLAPNQNNKLSVVQSVAVSPLATRYIIRGTAKDVIYSSSNLLTFQTSEGSIVKEQGNMVPYIQIGVTKSSGNNCGHKPKRRGR